MDFNILLSGKFSALRAWMMSQSRWIRLCCITNTLKSQVLFFYYGMWHLWAGAGGSTAHCRKRTPEGLVPVIKCSDFCLKSIACSSSHGPTQSQRAQEAQCQREPRQQRRTIWRGALWTTTGGFFGYGDSGYCQLYPLCLFQTPLLQLSRDWLMGSWISLL